MPKNRNKFGVNKRLPKGPHGGIELLLIQSVEHLGKQGEVVEVKPGYAKNFLIPQGLATIATEHHKRMIEKHKAKLSEISRIRRASLQAKADHISQETVTIEANVTDEGHLYGSVGAHDIVAQLKAKGITEISPEMVRLAGPLKELGLYRVKIYFGQEVEGELRVWVVPTGESAQFAQKQTEAAEPAEG